MAEMVRFGSIMGLAEGAAEKYIQLHQHVPDPVLEAIRDANISNYTIFRYEDWLFAYYEYNGANMDDDLGIMANDESTRRWWEQVGPLQKTLRRHDRENWWVRMEEVFHLD